MPQLKLELPHTIEREEAVRRLREKFAAAGAKYQDQVSDFQQQWVDHTFSFAFRAVGMSVSGEVAVEADRVCLTAQLPLAAMLFRGAIEDRIREELGNLLQPADANEGSS